MAAKKKPVATARGPKPLDEIKTTKDIRIPEDIVDQVIGQPTAVRKVRLAMVQRRHLLLVGPPGVGKSMLAQALAVHLPKPREQVNIIDNPANPQRPLVEIINFIQAEKILSPADIPDYVAVQLGFKCYACGTLSAPEINECPSCKEKKYRRTQKQDKISLPVYGHDGQNHIVNYSRRGDKIRVIGDDTKINYTTQDKKKRFTIIPVNRRNFVHATGASETELLGDVRHDPYGSHPEIGTPAYLRVVPGAVHEAHEGVLFVDELPHLEHLQNFILTAMQERRFPISGRNPQSGGASIKVEDVPCDFLFVGACNIKDVSGILPPLRSRILGNGYEILLETTMEDNPTNQAYLAQFVAQEIIKDAKIPHATKQAVIDIIDESRKRARIIDDQRNSLSLRLRDLGGVIRLAGDLATDGKSAYIESSHIKAAIEEAKPIEYQLQERYGSVWKGIEKDQIINPEYGKIGSSYL